MTFKQTPAFATRRSHRVEILLHAIFCLLALSACATAPRTPVADTATLPLAKPATLGSSREITQILRGAFGPREVTLQCVVNATADNMTIVGVTPLGLRAFTIKYDGEHVDAQRAPQVPEFFKPEQLINDLQLVFWPLPALQKTLAGTEWRVTEPHVGTRRLHRGDRLIAEVHYADPDPWAGRVWIVHFDVPYTIGIESRPASRTLNADKTARD
jgi:hypothetical protein